MENRGLESAGPNFKRWKILKKRKMKDLILGGEK